MGFWLFSGIDGELGWKTVPPTERSIRVNPINPCSKKKLGGKTNTDCTDITDFIRDGTVFQTALPSLLVIPRLRHGLLSLRSVLSSRQNLLPTTNMEFSAGWKPVPSVSESNPGRSLGIYNHGENCCLEDSTSHRAKHPLQSVKSVFEKKLGGG